MVQWKRLLGFDAERDGHRWGDEARQLLPTHHEDPILSPIPATKVTEVALRLRYLIEECVPCELEESLVTSANGRIITPNVVQTARDAGGDEHRACVIYALLVNKKWFRKQSFLELWDADLHKLRATAAEVIAKKIIESEDDQGYLFHGLLLTRYSSIIDGEKTAPANVIERAVDLRALRIIGSSGYQKCVNYLWRGWLVQDEDDPTRFVDYKNRDNPGYWAHLHPDRIRAPIYQNAIQIIFSLICLGLYTGAINTVNPTGDLDSVEIILYIFILGFICDEFSKIWKVGRDYVGFWNVFNLVLYGLLSTSFVARLLALRHPLIDGYGKRAELNELSYDFLAFSAPMFWMRLLLHLESIRFFGVMLVVLKVMMKESIIFFALLVIIIVGFLQAFVGMNNAESQADATKYILQAMTNALLGSPDFGGFDNFAPPFGIILYYIFTFLIMVILLNILIALYNSAYADITDNAVDQYMALFAQKTMQFVRAPDENVFIAPLNLIEIIFLIVPLEWWMPRQMYAKLNDYIMGVLYSPFLLFAAYIEQRSAARVRSNRTRGEEDDDTVEEWEQMAADVNFENEGWDRKVAEVKPDVGNDAATIEVKKLRGEVGELRELIEKLLQKREAIA